ncbi:MAG TPA: efflux transporter outer membrane subunit [Dissulfurispiraceae bacterium]|nr:efflux transporter outer membrane subunit [Dissulfurispiraceae bacterium]
MIPLKPCIRYSFIFCTFILSFGCTVGPDYVKPTADTPPSYKEIGDTEWKVAQPSDDVKRGSWWEIYGDSQLNALEEQVKISNQNIAAAEAQYRQARALVQGARAAYFPTASLDASFTRSSRGSGSTAGLSAGASAARASSTVSDYLLSGNVSWEPDIWGKVRRTVEASEANAQASSADLESLILSLQAELAQNYFQLCAIDAQKQLYDSTVKAYQTFLEMTKNRYASGVASKADVLQAETQLRTAQAQAIDIGVQRAQLEHAIALLIGKPASAFSIPGSSLSARPPGIPVGMPSDLLERRPDIAAAERRVAAANAQIGVAKAAYYPNITLSASGGFESSHLSKWLTWPNRFWSVGTNVLETVFDGGLRASLTEQARAAYDANVAAYRQTVLTGFQEVEDNLAALRILEQEATVLEEALKAARQSVVVILNQYKAGTVSYLDVVNVQTIALNNERTALDIAGRRMTASVLLIKALGGGWSYIKQPDLVE